jgi:hypothetical protein
VRKEERNRETQEGKRKRYVFKRERERRRRQSVRETKIGEERVRETEIKRGNKRKG